MNLESLEKALLGICTYLNENEIEYVIVGGFSVIALGRARTTEDLDLIINHEILNIDDFVFFLNNNNYIADQSDFEGFKSKDHCTIFFKEGMFRIDIIGIYTRDNAISIQEAIEFDFKNTTIKIDSPESLITHKLKFGSPQDFEDALAVYVRNKDELNTTKMWEHSKRLNVEEKLKNLIKMESEL